MFPHGLLERAWYRSSIAELCRANVEQVLGTLASHSTFEINLAQRDAWREQIAHLQMQLRGFEGSILLEYAIPRMGRRIDAVVLLRGCVFVLEFKVGSFDSLREGLNQVWDYALDLKNFHAASHRLPIIPYLVLTEGDDKPAAPACFDADAVCRPRRLHVSRLGAELRAVSAPGPTEGERLRAWYEAAYSPSPTIIEAARALYAQHSVAAITRNDAGAKNLRDTTACISEIIHRSKEMGRKSICFVTGVPGAGKTLVGLNVATARRERDSPTHAVFLSGNQPLVSVLVEALARDEWQRRKESGTPERIGRIRESVKAFIQNLHHFRDEALHDSGPPADHVVIFDEAQRAWDHQQTANFMQRKKGRPGFQASEPEFLLQYMDRHREWCTVICLVGGGQEINTGEAGISEWLGALQRLFPHWDAYCAPNLSASEYAPGPMFQAVFDRTPLSLDERLHLSVSMRSFRAESVSSFVHALLDGETDAARGYLGELRDRFPIVLTRDLSTAKAWTKQAARGTERFGLLATSKAMRLKPHAIDIRVSADPVHWFLHAPEDTRSSNFLEDAATEFQVQGLEVDWACVAWDGDLRRGETEWSFHDFRGAKWCNIANANNRRYLKNAYRVLLTRARQGMVLFVPPGDAGDATRQPEFYDGTFNYLRAIGIPTIG